MPTDKIFELSQLQKRMQTALITPPSQAFDPEQFVNDSSRLSAAHHLNIYRQSYIARLRECMKNQFSALNYALGEDLFQMFADQYLENNPSDSYTLNTLGEKFPEFLQETRPDVETVEKESWIDFMIELANFEYSLSVIFDESADEEIVPADDFAPDETLKLIPVFYLFRHTYPVCRYYLDVVKKNAPELPFENETFCAVTRNTYRLGLLEINPAQFYFLGNLRGGKSIADAKNQVVGKFDFDAAKFENVWQVWRKRFIAAGFFQQK